MNLATRRYDIDWLRVLAILLMFVRHSTRPFNYGWYYIKNDQLDLGWSLFVTTVDQWIMPLFFVLSGMSLYYALENRTNVQYCAERFRRLAIPLIFGVLVLVSSQDYVERVSTARFFGSFVQFLPSWYGELPKRLLVRLDWNGITHHLWYLGFLFVFSLLALPLFRFLRSKAGRRHISIVAAISRLPGTIFLLALPIALTDYLRFLHPYTIFRRGGSGWSTLTYLVFFILGFLVASDPRFREAVERARVPALVMGVITLLAGIVWLRSAGQIRFSATLHAFNSWFWLVAILGFGSRYLDFGNNLLAYANEAVLPFYILHQTVIVLVAFYVVRWDMSIAAKYLIISAMSLAIIMTVYHLMIRPVNALRLLFGMKPRKQHREALATV